MKEKRNAKNAPHIILSIYMVLILLFSSVVMLIQVTTNSIIRQIEEALVSPVYYIYEDYYIYDLEHFPESIDPNIEYVPFTRKDPEVLIKGHFNKRRLLPEGVAFEDCVFDIKVTRIFAWHNFHEGYLWIMYTCIVSLSDGTIWLSSRNIPVKLTIERRGDHWVATDIFEYYVRV